jgi:hypothetical protein
MDAFVVSTPNVSFSNLTMNQMACVWLIRQAQPWSRIEDPMLRGMVQYLRKDAHLFGRRWAADEAKQINLSLKEKVFTELKVSQSFMYLLTSLKYILRHNLMFLSVSQIQIQPGPRRLDNKG